MEQCAASPGIILGRRPHGFGRSVQMDLSDDERVALTMFCRHYSIVDEYNRPLSGEAARLLATIALTAGHPPVERATVALRAQALMAVCALGHRIARRFRTVEEAAVPMDQPTADGSRTVRMSYDTVLLRLLEPLAPMFRTERGQARDKLLARYLMDQGLVDPDLHIIASAYSVKSKELRDRIAAEEPLLVDRISSIVDEWANGGAG